MINLILSLYLLFQPAGPLKTVPVTVHFQHLIQGEKITRGTAYQLTSGDSISIKKLKYYVSNISFATSKADKVSSKEIYLVDAFASDSLTLYLPEGQYRSLSFLLGVDSIFHIGGVQDGALDPLNDMYWAWNSGYVNFKLEGYSPQAKTDLNRVEYHIGGFAAAQKTMRNISLAYEHPVKINQDKSQVYINVHLDKLWDKTLIIANTGLVIKAGPEAVLIADRLPKMFSKGSKRMY